MLVLGGESRERGAGYPVRFRTVPPDPERMASLTWPGACGGLEVLNHRDRPRFRSLARAGTSENGSS